MSEEPRRDNSVSALPRVRRTLIYWIGGLLGLLVLSACKSDRLSERSHRCLGRRSIQCCTGRGPNSAQRDHLNKRGHWQQKARTWPQCTKLDPGAALRPQTTQSFDCLDAASPSRIHSSACLRSISRAKGSSAFSAAWRQSLAWCSHNSTCDDIGLSFCLPANLRVHAHTPFVVDGH